MISSCGLPPVPIGEQCGCVQLLIWDAHCAVCPLIHHFNIPFCQKEKKKLLQEKEHTSEACDLSGGSHGLCLSMPGIRIVVLLLFI